MESYSKQDIIQMMKEFNKQFGSTMKINHKTKKNLLNEFKPFLSCKLDKCILNRSKRIKDVLKPLGPNQNEWLSNFDILKVMDEYEKLYDNFKFLGCVPIDFNEFDKSFTHFNLKKFMKTKEIMGAIFNLDPSYQSGSHWVSLCLNIPKRTLCFFDSSGSSPVYQIQTFIDKLIEQGKKNKINFKIYVNNKRHQMGNSACGIYAIHFIIKQLQGKSCNELNNNVIHDKKMKENLKIYFN